MENKEKLIKKYNEAKKELDELRSAVTLRKWEILSKAYKLGIKIWGKKKFTRQRLAFDMEMPMTTVLRCLSLDRANKKSLKLMRENKISAFKLAMICQLKSKTYQDEIVDMVIKDNLSTYQIKSLKINNLKDINIERHRLATEKGYSVQRSAYINFKNWIERGKLFLLMRETALTKTKLEEIKTELSELNKRIEKYLSE